MTLVFIKKPKKIPLAGSNDNKVVLDFQRLSLTNTVHDNCKKEENIF